MPSVPVLLAAMLLAALGTVPVSALTWQIETVDANGTYVGGSTSLALDSAGHPHISYDGGGLRYAAYDGSAWETQIVDPVSVGTGTSLMLDAAGTPHIGYCDYSNYYLKYATHNGSAWRIETVDTDGWVGLYPSLALDGAGHPRISYMDGKDDTVKYAAFDGSAWRIERLDQAGGYASDGTSLVLDGAGNPCIGYLGTTGLKYATYNGTAWQLETVGPDGYYPSLALDSAGNPHIASFTYWPGLLYRARDGPAWRTEWVEWNRDTGRQASLALDADDTPRISYTDSMGSALKYAAYNRSTWQWDTETVDQGRETGRSSSLALDDAGNPRISYSGTNALQYGTTLKYARADIPRPVVLAIPGGAGLPAGIGAAWIRDDVNGNGRRDFADVVLYFNQMSWIAANEPLSAFDYNDNGSIDFADIVWLFVNLDSAPLRTFTVRAVALGPGTIQPSGDLTVREGENVTFTLRVGPGVAVPSYTGSGWNIGNEVRLDPLVAPTPYPEPRASYGPYPAPYNYTSSYTVRDVQANHTVYGVFYKAGYSVH